ncbi:receptor-type guanylate cyclase Gyc76C-like [Helicoverpa zea]|uniref:receptor-type guanylate cyclase Gyc76C-like n=1 Tax=Helicoverpa zea TaxID=7113 RepID=UPI001F574282|nr:receptor-type guanylate cyclase Gyc76C [Helicoverpa armigera]XP_047021545.1 receptor-type guanylate cyclase Gyc76C-like [Helicoverpa zea]XP_047021546.1 receptor-type guanylate cyclase Gyc76C-like [Helicoverpa zea]XP_047021547.1 receptor-type guanylate cyclase Gyc76C-like [Helicoverpa zea]XP_047021548.1 receptor-type guanylate cyclase Gyc76C-like [Helicoverpa zea]XP_047021549.1 receptor-type guanylate cyclase Gyc76C-like [Helicoverpa zea]XP_047021550.1 receptor-type guanylate cyclase Gyc76C
MWRSAQLLVVAALSLLAEPSLAAKKFNLTIGYLPCLTGDLRDRQGLTVSGALSIALEELNNSTELLPDVELLLEWHDTKFDTVTATRLLTDMSCSGVVAFFGPEGRCHTEAIIAQSRNLPMISYKCSDYQTSTLSNFARLEPPGAQATKSVISLLRYYRWNKFSILYEESWVTVALTLENHAKKNNMTVNHQRPVIESHKCCEEKMTCCAPGFWYQFIQDTKNRTRIYVFLGSPGGLIDMMTAMESLKLFSKGEYMVIFVDMMTYSPKDALKYLIKTEDRVLKLGCPNKVEFKKRAQSLLVVVSSEPSSSYEEFTNKVRKYNTIAPFNFKEYPIIGSKFSKFVSIYAAYLYDSVKLYAKALNEIIKEETRTEPLTEVKLRSIATNGTRIVAKMIQSSPYKSISGMSIRLDERADSEGNFSVLAYKPTKNLDGDVNCTHSMIPVGHFHQNKREFPEYKLNPRLPIDWPDSVKPEDEPSCGFLNEKCPKDDSQITSLVVAGTLAVTLFCALVVTISIYRKWKIEQEIEGLLWKIDPQEIAGYLNSGLVWSPSKLSLASGISCESRCCTQIFTTTAQFKGNLVRIKELKFSKKKDIPREIMKEMRLLRELRHDNLNSFIGAVVEPLRVLILTDYCAKGSLYDIIENEDIKLDTMFISSLIHDLIKGMIFIHTSPLIYHGNLKSSNCVVTSRWMLQVADFGLHELRSCAENEFIGEHQYYRGLLWKAPELLREMDNPNGIVGGTQKGDVYAFGIILYEIIARRGPFGLTGTEPKDIIERLKRPKLNGEEVFRPNTDALDPAPEEYVVSCMKDCWAEDPNLRPDFPIIRSRLKKMKSGKSRNIMDQMMDMMEKYANNLEELVNERTRLLIEEKQKTEDLLHRMLPKSVARRLTTGEGVEPESFDSVTIYFSDIVGFTAMSAESTPLQVVNFLNDLYTVFDRIIRGYDVYKVETIGDAYMVVSGLPIRNSDRHVGEIASMALELLNAVKSHKISHRPNETLKLRIGIHTGAVVAGVVGLTMPRYCLFGDTVNTASRMESNGEPLKIHISPSCKQALDKIGGYIVEPRGTIPIKGKGQLQTYWLISATEKAIQKRAVEGEERPLFRRPRRSPRLADSRHPSLSGGGGSTIRQRLWSGARDGDAMRGSRCSLPAPLCASPSSQRRSRPEPAAPRPRHALSSIASSTACEADAEDAERWALRAHSLDVLPPVRMRRHHTTRSLDHEVGVATVCGDPVFNGTIIGIVTDDAPRDEDSPLLRKTSLATKLERPRRKAPEASYIEFYKRWRSLENVADGKATERKAPRFPFPSWLLGFFSGAARVPSGDLRRAPPLLDTESAV